MKTLVNNYDSFLGEANDSLTDTAKFNLKVDALKDKIRNNIDKANGNMYILLRLIVRLIKNDYFIKNSEGEKCINHEIVDHLHYWLSHPDFWEDAMDITTTNKRSGYLIRPYLIVSDTIYEHQLLDPFIWCVILKRIITE